MNKAIVGLTVIAGIGLLFFLSCGEPATQKADDMLNSVMDYIKVNHPDAALFIEENIQWTKSVPERRVGYTGVTYTGSGWTVAIGHAITAEIIYEVRAEYTKEGIVWVGTIKDNVITEESYTKE